jgi:hypothetical protein
VTIAANRRFRIWGPSHQRNITPSSSRLVRTVGPSVGSRLRALVGLGLLAAVLSGCQQGPTQAQIQWCMDNVSQTGISYLTPLDGPNPDFNTECQNYINTHGMPGPG